MAHADDIGRYEGPICDMCRTSMFIGTCTHRPRRQPEWSPEMMALAKRAAEASEAENAKVAAMSPEEREKYIAAWAERLARDVAGLND